MQEGISYIAGAELPCLIVNVMRGGPGLGTIQPSQADYFQTVKGGGHGDYRLIVLAPASVQEMADFVDLSFELAFKYRNPAMILSDGVIGQMMEKVVLPPFKPRRTEEEIAEECPWATTGRTKGRQPNIVTSLELDPAEMEKRGGFGFSCAFDLCFESDLSALFYSVWSENAYTPGTVGTMLVQGIHGIYCSDVRADLGFPCERKHRPYRNQSFCRICSRRRLFHGHSAFQYV
jgi:hypothetical protein